MNSLFNFEHVSSNYRYDQNNTFAVKMLYRKANKFGAIVKGGILVKINENCEVVSVEETY